MDAPEKHAGHSQLTNDKSRLRLDLPLLQAGSVEQKVGTALEMAWDFMMKSHPANLIDNLFVQASGDTRNLIKAKVKSVDHVGFIVPPGASSEELDRITKAHKFPENHKQFPSVVVASELTSLNGGAPVLTTIFRGSTLALPGHAGTFGVEMFAPNATPETVAGWISSGIGSHVAFRVGKREAVDEIRELLLHAGYATPAFMGGHSMANAHDGTLTVYFDLATSSSVFRVEFFHRDLAG